MSSRGFTVVEIILIVATVAIIAFVGFAIYQASQDVVEFEEQLPGLLETTNDTADIPVAPEIEDEGDLSRALETLEGIDLDEEMTADSELESESEVF